MKKRARCRAGVIGSAITGVGIGLGLGFGFAALGVELDLVSGAIPRCSSSFAWASCGAFGGGLTGAAQFCED